MKSVSVLILLLLSMVSQAQLHVYPEEINFDVLRKADQNWRDISVHNQSGEVAHLFRVECPKHIDVLFSSKTIAPDSVATIRVSYSPKEVGKFKEVLQIYASAWQKPVSLVVKGDASYAASELVPCPQFGKPDEARNVNYFVSVVNVDRSKKNLAEKVALVFYKEGQKVQETEVNELGEARVELAYGRYLVSARSRSSVLDTVVYINAVSDYLQLKMEFSTPENERLLQPELPTEAEIAEQPALAIPTPTVQTPPAIKEYDANLPENKYKQNNLVFLVDVSTSMKKNGKLDILKIAMIDLLEVLRPEDRFALISYSSETQTIVQTESNLDRAACIAAIDALTAGGSTEGAKAIDVAGRTSLQHFVEQGNNQILLATDGAFNEATDKAKKIVAKYERRDIQLSVIGIKCGPFTTKQMTELAAIGGGRFIPVSDSFDAGAQLLDEVKRSALK